jgi:hypothetical protein
VTNSLGEPKIISSIKEIFAKYFPSQLRTHADKLHELRIVIKFIVHGDGGGVWLIDLTEPGGRIIPGDGEAGCTFTVSAKDLYEIVTGELNAAAALARGIVKVSGDLEQAFEVGRILLLA